VTFPAIRATGANGTQWRTDVAFINPSSQPANVVIRISGGPIIALIIAPGEMRLFHDIIGIVPGLTGLHVFTIDSLGTPLLVTSRTWTSNATGSYGQFVAASAALANSAIVTGVDDNDAFRANIGFTVAAGPAIVYVRVFDANDNPRGTGSFVVDGGEPLQIPLRSLTGSPLTNGRITFETDSNLRLGYAYASVVDNSSSDPSFIPAH
jgi:hypothetical protein